ncbi:pro-corazonin [Fopius arisanus]|uniref:Crz protein n=1 Tax=Fopius arisanus TaxID=64838 RepID=A0A0C9RBH4_9HYME|nr:PREDICTED: pro-corazonin-like [Fopius arisanus]
MTRALIILMILVGTISVITGQTFQYSRGWTTGKRADSGVLGVGGDLPSDLKMNFPTQGIIRRTNDPENIHCGLRKLKMLLRGSTNNQLYHLPCDLLNILHREVEAGSERVGHHKNSHHLDLYDNDNDNVNDNDNYLNNK